MLRNLILFTGLVFLISCKTYFPDTLPDTQLRFGNGGGFTGMTTEYLLLRNGQLFTRTGRLGTEAWQALKSVKQRQAKALFERWEEEPVFRQNIRRPGNRYYFIHMKTDSLEYRQSWGSGNFKPVPALKSFYGKAMELVTQVTEKEPL